MKNTTTKPYRLAQKNKLKIGLVFDDSLDRFDGVQQYILNLANYYSSLGHQVYFLVGETHSDDARIMSLSRNLTISFNGNRLSIPRRLAFKKAQQLLANLRLDILHVQMPYSPLLAGQLIKARTTERLVGSFLIYPYNKFSYYANQVLASYLKPQIKQFETIITVSEPAENFARQLYGSTINYRRIGLGFDYRHYATAQPEAKKVNFRLIFLGRLVKRKGAITLLKALRVVANSLSDQDFELQIAGAGPLKAQLEKFVQVNHLDRLVKFRGYLSESAKAQFLASADLAVFPSLAGESFGIVLLEAMSSPTSLVLASANPGYKATLSQLGAADILFEPNDHLKLAELILKYYNDQQLRLDLALKQQSFAQAFDNSIIAEKVLDCYDDVLKQSLEK